MPRQRLAHAFRLAWPVREWADATDRQVHVALFDLNQWMAWLPDAITLLDGAETARVNRRHRRVDREFLALSYALHRLFLGRVLGWESRLVPLGRDRLGCPTVGGLPVGTSLSHSDEFLALAASRRGPVGVDIESRRRTAVLPEIAEAVCHPAEAVRLQGASHEVLGDSLLALWVRKEALLKAAGVGLARGMQTFQAPEGTALPLHGPGGPTIQLTMLGADPSVTGAVAAPPGVPVLSAWLRPPSGLS